MRTGIDVARWAGGWLALAVLGAVFVAPAAAQTYDLLLKGGHVIDPANEIDRIMDVAVKDDKIARVAEDISSDEAKKTLDVTGLYVTPGLIDLHAHVTGYSGSLFPDDTALLTGTTTVVDCGGAGWRSFEDFKKTIIDTSKTRVLAFINIVGHGMLGSDYESNVDDMDPEKTAAKMKEYPDLIVGIKTAHFNGKGWVALRRAIEAGKLSGKPVIIDDKIFTGTGRNDARKSARRDASGRSPHPHVQRSPSGGDQPVYRGGPALHAGGPQARRAV